MKMIGILVALSALLATSASTEGANPWQGKKVPSLVLADGKTYTEVTFTKVEPDAIWITHSGGIVRIPMENLQPDSQAALGYDPVKAADAREKYEIEKAAAARRAQVEAANRRASAMAKADREKKIAAAVKCTFIVVAVPKDGPLVKKLGGDVNYLLKGYKGKPLVDRDEFIALCIETDKTYQYVSADGTVATVAVIEALSVKNGE